MGFARHETFYIREGWLFKGMQAIDNAESADEQPTIFLDKDAPERLGIGRNMVRSLRFWMQATGLAEEMSEGRTVHRLTDFGKLVWTHDRFIEDPLTLWLLHYHLVSNEEFATTWYWFFNHYSPTQFDDQSALESLQSWATGYDPDRSIAISSLKKDVRCLLQTYLVDEKKHSPEDMKHSPFTQLEILARGSGRQKSYYWQRANLTQIHPLAVLYVLLDRQEKSVRESNELLLRDALYEPMNVGRVFNITTAGLIEMISLLRRDFAFDIEFVGTAQLNQIKLPQNVTALDVLRGYYETEREDNFAY